MRQVRKWISKINKDGKFLPRLLVALCVVAGAALVIILISYATRSQIRYTLQTADCSQSAVDARNKANGGDSKACILVIQVTNLKNTTEFVDWLGTGGGPLAGWHPMIRINAMGGKFCYAGVNLEDVDSLGPYESRNLRIGCSNSDNMPKDYDEHSDENPTSIEIDDWSDVTLPVTPAR